MKFRPVGSGSDWYRLLRIDRPVGYWLLMWPMLWGLFAASGGHPSIKNIVIFVAGVVLMRSAGCVINDFADRDFDAHVERTKTRPIAAGKIAPGAALVGFIAMLLVALLLVLQTSTYVMILAVVGVVLASLYPFLKRFTYFPQAWLGMAFGWAVIMGWGAETGDIFDSPVPWLLFFANVCWSLSYDTAYALADRSDDRKIGVKSSALWLGSRAVGGIVVLGLLNILFLGLAALILDGFWVGFGWWLALMLQLMLSGQLMRCGESWGFTFFLQSHYVGALFALGLLADGLSTLLS
ncbi:MAG: 4-hydroxybenzoate octaprenyltransferase [Mariprofundus sp.]|nr:4-hydroxybenzoate octaprenyltransferase [Mariprofundus sp.]